MAAGVQWPGVPFDLGVTGREGATGSGTSRRGARRRQKRGDNGAGLSLSVHRGLPEGGIRTQEVGVPGLAPQLSRPSGSDAALGPAEAPRFINSCEPGGGNTERISIRIERSEI